MWLTDSPDSGTGKTCLGGGMTCPSAKVASSLEKVEVEKRVRLCSLFQNLS